jgi:hypothetical protein
MKNAGTVQRRAFKALKVDSKELFWPAVSGLLVYR